MHISNYEAGFWTGVGVTVIVRFLWVASRAAVRSAFLGLERRHLAVARDRRPGHSHLVQVA